MPLYLLYRGKGEPVIRPQILTGASVLDALGECDPQRGHARLNPIGIPLPTAENYVSAFEKPLAGPRNLH